MGFSENLQAAQKTLSIGVLATRVAERCLNDWKSTAEYLTRHIPDYHFIIVPLEHNQIISSVKNQRVDFIFTNSSYYVELEQDFGVNRIATIDVTEAISTFRFYRPAQGIDAAMDEIKKYRGITYDADVADTCRNLFKTSSFHFYDTNDRPLTPIDRTVPISTIVD